MTDRAAVVKRQHGWRRPNLVLAIIVALAFTLRCWGIQFGLPGRLTRPDECTVVNQALRMTSRPYSPGFFNYPSAYLDLNLLAYFAYYGFEKVLGRVHDFSDIKAQWAVSAVPLLLIDRYISAVLGTLSTLIIYFIGKRLINVSTGLGAALFLAVSYLHVRDSHFGTVDVAMTFFAWAAILAMLWAYQTGDRRRFCVAGFISGIAVSTKYNAIALTAPLFFSIVYSVGRPHFPVRWRGRALLVLLTLGSMAFGFLVMTPYLAWDWGTFKQCLRFEVLSKMAGPGFANVESGRGWITHLRFSLWYGVGGPILLCGLAGGLMASRRSYKTALVVFGFPLAWWLGVGVSRTVFVRYAIPMVPGLCIGASCFCEIFSNWLGRTFIGGLQKPALILTVLLFAMVPAMTTCGFNRMLGKEDSRQIAADWINAHVTPGSKIGISGHWAGYPPLFETPSDLRQAIDMSVAMERRPSAELQNMLFSIGGLEMLRARLNYALSHAIKGYSLAAYDGSTSQFVNVVTFDRLTEAPDCLVVQRFPLEFSSIETSLMTMVESRYTLAFEIKTVREGATSDQFDRQDAFFLPYHQFDLTERPGPTIQIFIRAGQ